MKQKGEIFINKNSLLEPAIKKYKKTAPNALFFRAFRG
jgi:hypothetical protein